MNPKDDEGQRLPERLALESLLFTVVNIMYRINLVDKINSRTNKDSVIKCSYSVAGGVHCAFESSGS